VIDVACGPGVVAAHLARNGAHVTGVDLTPKMLELARERAAASGCSQLTSFVEGRMEALDFGAASFTVAVSRYALHHAADPSAVVAELCRVVEPGGRVVVVDFAAPDDPVAAGAYDEAERRRDPSHVRNLTRSEQRALFVTRGWEVESESGYRMPARLEAVLARSHGPDHDGVRRAFEASLDNHRLGVDARRTGNGIVFDYPIAAWAFTRRSERRS
jgi:SAM-dependent methyltransferase